MNYLGKNASVNGRATRDKFVRSMDLAANRTPEAAREAYEQAWFSSRRKQYLNEALKMAASRSLFWPVRCVPDMLDEILADFEGDAAAVRELAKEADMLKSLYCLWARPSKSRPVDMDRLKAAVKKFEAEHAYRCPDTYRSAWMNTGAYVTLCYGIKYEGLRLPGCPTADASLALLKKLAMEVIAGMDHDVDDRLFRVCHALYLDRLEKLEEKAGAPA